MKNMFHVKTPLKTSHNYHDIHSGNRVIIITEYSKMTIYKINILNLYNIKHSKMTSITSR